MFNDQAKTKNLNLEFYPTTFLDPPGLQGERTMLPSYSLDEVNTGLPCLEGDEIRLSQVLINLVKNSLKFTSNGYIHIHSSYNYIEQMLYFHIRDSGKGISEEDMQKLFHRFGKLTTAHSQKMN